MQENETLSQKKKRDATKWQRLEKLTIANTSEYIEQLELSQLVET